MASASAGQARRRPFIPPLQTGQNIYIGRRTGLNVLPRKPIPTDEFGLESFGDYFTDTEEETVSIAPKKVSLPPNNEKILETPPSHKRKLSLVSAFNSQSASESSKRSRVLDNERVVPKKLVWNPDAAEIVDDVPLLRLSIGELSGDDDNLDEQFDRLKNRKSDARCPVMSTPACGASDFADALPRQPLASISSPRTLTGPKRAKKQNGNGNAIARRDTRDSDGSVSEAYDEADNADAKRAIFSPPLPPPEASRPNLPRSASKIPVLVKSGASSAKAHRKMKVMVAKPKMAVGRQRNSTPIPVSLRATAARGKWKKSPDRKDAAVQEAKERSVSPIKKAVQEQSRYPIRDRVSKVQSPAKSAQTKSGNSRLRSSKGRIRERASDEDEPIRDDAVMANFASTKELSERAKKVSRIVIPESSASDEEPVSSGRKSSKTSRMSTAALTVSGPKTASRAQRPTRYRDHRSAKGKKRFDEAPPDADPQRVTDEPALAFVPIAKSPLVKHSRRNPEVRNRDSRRGKEKQETKTKKVAAKKKAASKVTGRRLPEFPLPDTEDGAVRKSSRVRVPALAYWRNERILYEPDEVTGAQKFMGILNKDQMPEENAPKKRSKAKKHNRRVAEDDDDDDDRYDSEQIGEEHMNIKAPITVINPDSKELVAVDCVAPIRSCIFYGSNKNVATKSDTIIITKTISQLAFAQGIIRIGPYEEKKTSSAKMDTLAFFIVAGTVKVTIHETEVLLTKKDSFFVPRGNKYSMKNPMGTTAELCFFQLRGG